MQHLLTAMTHVVFIQLKKNYISDTIPRVKTPSNKQGIREVYNFCEEHEIKLLWNRSNIDDSKLNEIINKHW